MLSATNELDFPLLCYTALSKHLRIVQHIRQILILEVSIFTTLEITKRPVLDIWFLRLHRLGHLHEVLHANAFNGFALEELCGKLLDPGLVLSRGGSMPAVEAVELFSISELDALTMRRLLKGNSSLPQLSKNFHVHARTVCDLLDEFPTITRE
jgi:hypothetical protein